MAMSMFTLLTDFGNEGWFVGAMKGVIVGLAPGATVIDLTHQVSPGDVRAGAFALLAAYHYFPPGTIHIVVVDPGVGSARPALLVTTERYSFLGPDNGVLSWALRDEQVKSIHQLSAREYFLPHISQTFHGRDVFAPAAAHLAKGVPPEAFGCAQPSFHKLPWPDVREVAGSLHGEILYVDRFGNAISNLPNTLRTDVRFLKAAIVANGTRCPVRDFYQAVPPGQPVAVPGSVGLLEIAVNGGSAAVSLQLTVGTPVTLTSEDAT
jgi:hypothetical protein